MLSEHHPRLHYNSLKNAWSGILASLATQRNFRLELIFGLIALFLAYVLEFTQTKFVVVIGTILLVLSFEMLNTSVEALVDSVHVEHHPLAKISKDASAGAVLIVTILAAIIGLYLYLPAFLALYY